MYLIKLEPTGKDYLWGGEYLKRKYNKCLNVNPLAETWEFSTHPNGSSIVANGKYKGKTLSELFKLEPKIFGKKKFKDGSPILVKLIDANKDLSVQVHPSDEFAKKNENQMGKTEMWYILEASKGAKIVYGFEYDVTPEMIRKALQDHTFEQLLHYEEVKKGDCIYIPSGTIHALGKGIVCAEIQESSDVTYRLYDYDRVDASGNKRPLHLEKALDVLNYTMQYESIRQKKLIEFDKEYIIEHLNKNEYFDSSKYTVKSKINIIKEKNSFDIILFLEGEGTILSNNENLICKGGNCIIIPSEFTSYQIIGKLEFIKITI